MNKTLSVYLDLLRFLAAIAVLLGHSRVFLTPDLSKWVASHASESVAVFFVLSGFVIRYVTTDRERRFSSYAIARSSRILSVVIPAVALTLTADALGYSWFPEVYQSQEFWNGPTSWVEALRSISFTNEIWFTHVVMGTNEPFWSLGYEVPYYIAFAVIFIRNRLVQILLLTLWVAFFGPAVSMYSLLWILGAATFDAVERIKLSKVSAGVVLALVCSPLCYPVLKYVMFPPMFSLFRTGDLNFMMQHFVYYLLIAGLVSAHLIGVVLSCNLYAISVPHAVSRPTRWLAGATFTIYLMHQPLLIAARAFLEGKGYNSSSAPYIALFLVFMGLLGLAELGERRNGAIKAWLRRPVKAFPQS